MIVYGPIILGDANHLGLRISQNDLLIKLEKLAYANMKTELKLSGIELVSVDLLKEVWTDRPALPSKPFFVFDSKYSGKTVKEKLILLRAELKKAHAQVFTLSALDDIAWLFNIRGNDVAFNPVVIAYALVVQSEGTVEVNDFVRTP